MKTKAIQRYFQTTFTVTLMLFLFILGTSLGYSQGAYKMTQKELHQFKVAKSHHYAGQQAFLKKKYSKAIESFEKCIETMPQYSSAYYFLAKIYYLQNKLDLAQSNMELAKKHYKFMNDIMINTRLEYHQTLRRQREDMQKDLSNTMLKLSRAELANLENKIAQIDLILNKPIVDIDHMPPDYFYLSGNIYFKVKKLKEAHDEYLGAIKTDPSFEPVYNNLISLYLSIKRADKALEYCKKAQSYGVKLNDKLLAAVKNASRE